VHESIVLSFFWPACIAHTVAILLHGCWAIYDPFSTSLWSTTHHMIWVITISCKSQGRVHPKFIVEKKLMKFAGFLFCIKVPCSY